MRKAQFFAAATTTFARRELCNPPCSPRFTAARSPPPRQATVFATRRARPRAGRPSRARRAAFGSSSTATAPRRNPAESPGAATTASTTAEDTTAPARAEAAEAARSAAEDAARPAATDTTTTTTTTTTRIGTSAGTAAAEARFARRDAAGAASTPSEGSAATATEGTGASAFVATIGDTTAATRSRGGTTEFRPDATTTAAGIPSPTTHRRLARRATAANAVPTA